MKSIHHGIGKRFIPLAIGLALLTVLFAPEEQAEAGASKAVFAVA